MKIGVFICQCGNNISGMVDVNRVVEAAWRRPKVVYAATLSHLCSEPGQHAIGEAITAKNLDKVVIGACSPRIHEATFQRLLVRTGLNPYLLEIANLREHCSWIHEDREAATHKAIELVSMAVAAAARRQPLYPSTIDMTKRGLVIGGGIGGIQAALDMADAGYEVTIVERRSSIGGNMARMDKIFPTLDCSACILSPKMAEVGSHPRITLYTWSEIEDVSGFVGNFEVTIRKKARYVDTTKCTGCGECTYRCPIKTPDEFNLNLGRRRAIYIPFPQAVPYKPVIDKDYCTYLLRGKCGLCQKICPAGAIDYQQEDELIQEKFGAIVAATGYSLVDWTMYGEYGYGKYKDVISSLQYERILSASGPTGGHILRPSDNKPPKVVAIIACVGSRDEARGRPYCSSVCCMYTAKYTMLTKEHIPDSKVFVFYMDIRATGKMYEEFVRRAQEQYGAIYVRGRVSKMFSRNGRIVLQGADTLLGDPVELEADLVVLAVGMTSATGAIDLAKKLNISHDAYGFFTESHPKLRPVESSTPGIFIAGVCQGPKDIPLTVAQASSAASKVMGLFSMDKLETSPQVALVDARRCVGCFRCLQVCPFKAIEEETLRDGSRVARVNPALCQGCGLCAATCLPAVISLKGFTDDQLLAEVESLCYAK